MICLTYRSACPPVSVRYGHHCIDVFFLIGAIKFAICKKKRIREVILLPKGGKIFLSHAKQRNLLTQILFTSSNYLHCGGTNKNIVTRKVLYNTSTILGNECVL